MASQVCSLLARLRALTGRQQGYEMEWKFVYVGCSYQRTPEGR